MEIYWFPSRMRLDRITTGVLWPIITLLYQSMRKQIVFFSAIRVINAQKPESKTTTRALNNKNSVLPP